MDFVLCSKNIVAWLPESINLCQRQSLWVEPVTLHIPDCQHGFTDLSTLNLGSLMCSSNTLLNVLWNHPTIGMFMLDSLGNGFLWIGYRCPRMLFLVHHVSDFQSRWCLETSAAGISRVGQPQPIIILYWESLTICFCCQSSDTDLRSVNISTNFLAFQFRLPRTCSTSFCRFSLDRRIIWEMSLSGDWEDCYLISWDFNGLWNFDGDFDVFNEFWPFNMRENIQLKKTLPKCIYEKWSNCVWSISGNRKQEIWSYYFIVIPQNDNGHFGPEIWNCNHVVTIFPLPNQMI